MIRVLQLPGTISRLDGRMAVIMNIYRNLDRSKIQFDFVASIAGDQSYQQEIEQLGGKVYLLNGTPSFKEMYEYVKNILNNNHYEYMHYHAISPWGCTLGLGHKYGLKVITQSHATVYSEKFLKSIRNRLFSMNIIKDSDILVAVSPEAGKTLFRRHSFEYIPTWIDKDKYQFSLEKRQNIRKQLKLSDNDILVGNVSRFAVQKNHQFLIKAFDQLVKQNSKYHLALVGDGPLKNEIENYVNEHNLKNNVYFAGVVTNVADYYSAFDIFWLPSHFEGLPTVSLEALANGLPIVVSDKITREINIGNVNFLPINKSAINQWLMITDQNAKKRNDQNTVNNEFDHSVFKKNKVMQQWQKLYGICNK